MSRRYNLSKFIRFMIGSDLIKRKGISIQWIGDKPPGIARAVMLIPQYNESSNLCIEERLAYFNTLAEQYQGEIELVIIDDGSTDNSLQLIRDFAISRQASFYVASVSPNANKVGALSIVTREVKHEYVILSDLDTDIMGLENLLKQVDELTKDKSLMGCYFRMIPYRGAGIIFTFQQLEYCIARCLYRFHKKDRAVPVMPGAGCCFKRDILENVYWTHTGLRNGEDREATIIGLKKGYKVTYLSEVLALTRPPLSFKNLRRQRVRWNLGYIETVFLQKGFRNMKRSSNTSIRLKLYFDLLTVFFVLSLPLLSILIGIWNPAVLLVFYGTIYLLSVAWCLGLMLLSPEESKGARMKLATSVLLFPPIKLAVDYLAWLGAIRKFFKTDYSNIRRHLHMN